MGRSLPSRREDLRVMVLVVRAKWQEINFIEIILPFRNATETITDHVIAARPTGVKFKYVSLSVAAASQCHGGRRRSQLEVKQY